MRVTIGTIEPEHIPDPDATPFDFLPRDHESDRDEHGNPYPQAEIDRWHASDAEYIRSWQADEWRYIGIRARCTVVAEHDGMTFTAERHSHGLWSVEDNSGQDYLDEIFREESDTLKAMLREEYPGIIIEED